MKLAAFPYDTQRCNFTIGEVICWCSLLCSLLVCSLSDPLAVARVTQKHVAGSWAFSANQLDVAPKKIVATNVFEDSPTIAHRCARL
eukprot:1317607-Rhodomonas_salina.1